MSRGPARVSSVRGHFCRGTAAALTRLSPTLSAGGMAGDPAEGRAAGHPPSQQCVPSVTVCGLPLPPCVHTVRANGREGRSLLHARRVGATAHAGSQCSAWSRRSLPTLPWAWKVVYPLSWEIPARHGRGLESLNQQPSCLKRHLGGGPDIFLEIGKVDSVSWQGPRTQRPRRVHMGRDAAGAAWAA